MLNSNNSQSIMNEKTGKNQSVRHEMCNSGSFFDIENKSKIVDENSKTDHETLFKKRVWRIKDIADFLECSVGHIYNLSSRDLIPKMKKGKFLFFNPTEILEWINQGDYCEQK